MVPVKSLIFRSVLTGTAVLLGTGLSYRQWIVPLQHRQATELQEVAEVRERLRNAQEEMGGIKTQEQEANRIRSALNSVHANVPIGPAIAWFPPRLKTQLANRGVQAEVRLNSSAPEPGLASFERTYWHLSLPQQAGVRTMTDALLAVAQIEQQDNFVKILDFSFSETGDTGSTVGRVNLKAFVRK